MRRSWSNSPVRIHSSCAVASSSSSSPYSTIFACSTFKDIQNLCSADLNSDPHSSRKPSVFHRVRIATALLRSLSSSRQLQSSCSQSVPLSIASSTEPKHDTSGKTIASRSEQERKSELETTLTASESVRESKNDEDSVITSETKSTPSISLPGSEKRIVVYFTSLRVVRSTFEDCRTVRSILRWFPVSIDERDLSMDSTHLNELLEILGENRVKLKLPRVFIAGKYIGGAEEIRQLHESGELKNLVAELPPAVNGVCDGCGGYRFVVCDGCSGSHRVYTEKSGFRSCTACSENGLIECDACSFAPFRAVRL